MVHLPDNALIKRRFVDHLPDELVKTMCHTQGMNVETSTIEQVIEAAQHVEAAEYDLASRKKGGRAAVSTPVMVSKHAEDTHRGQEGKSWFMRLWPFQRAKEGFKLPYVPRAVSKQPAPKGYSCPAQSLGDRSGRNHNQGVAVARTQT
jgi:hypothetical protein